MRNPLRNNTLLVSNAEVVEAAALREFGALSVPSQNKRDPSRTEQLSINRNVAFCVNPAVIFQDDDILKLPVTSSDGAEKSSSGGSSAPEPTGIECRQRLGGLLKHYCRMAA